MELSYPLQMGALEELPYNVRKTKVVRFARSLDQAKRSALTVDLCALKRADSPATSLQLAAMKDRPDDLAGLLDSSLENADPTSAYHLQELGLLVAVSAGDNASLLEVARRDTDKIISKKARALCVHSICVSDDELQRLIESSTERERRTLVRACAREPIRVGLTTAYIESWLRETDERRVIAYELLHGVKSNTPWFGSTVRNIMHSARVAELNSSTNSDSAKKFKLDLACRAAVRCDLLWKFHSDDLLKVISDDVLASTSILDKAAAFDLWSPLISPESWTLPSKAKTSARLATSSSYIPFKKLFQLYVRNLPYQPTTFDVKNLWNSKRFNGVVQDPTAEDTLNLMQSLTNFHESWSGHISLLEPCWLSSPYVLRALGAEEVFDIVRNGLSEPDGLLKEGSKTLALTFLTRFVNKLIATGYSTALFGAIREQLQKVLKLVTPVLYYSGVRTAELYENRNEYLRAERIWQTFQAYLTFITNVLDHKKITTGQQLELFGVLQQFNKRMLLRVEDLHSPLQLLSISNMRSLMQKYQTFLRPYADVILASIFSRIQHASERGKSLDQLNIVFAQVVNLAFLNVQMDIEALHLALAKSMPAAFSYLPVSDVAKDILPRIWKLSITRDVANDTDSASRLVNDIFLMTIIPFVRQTAFTDDSLFGDQPGHTFSQLKAHKDDVAVRASALESMEKIRLSWFKDILVLSPAFNYSKVSDEAIDALFNILAEWIESAAKASERAAEAKRHNRHTTRGKSAHPVSAPNAECSLKSIATFLSAFIDTRILIYKRDEWYDTEQSRNVALLHRAFRWWSAASFYADNQDPLNVGGSGKLNPYVLEPLLRRVCAFPDAIRKPYEQLIVDSFALRLNGKIRYADGVLVDAPTSLYRGSATKESTPALDTKALFDSIACLQTRNTSSSEVLSALEKVPTELRASGTFIDSLQKYFDVSRPEFRRRIEQNLNKAAFADRLSAMSTLRIATHRTGSIPEHAKTLAKIAKAIENESLENRMSAIAVAFDDFGGGVLQCVLPSPTGCGPSKDRNYHRFLQSPPKDSDWPAIVLASSEIPAILHKILDDLLSSADEKSDSNMRPFRAISDIIIAHTLQWPCSVHSGTDARIPQVQKAWFDSAIELQWKLTLWKVGKAQSMTFRPMLSGATFKAIRNAIFESGFLCDRPYPKGKTETREYEIEANRRRREKASYIVSLFRESYEKRIGPLWAIGSPLGRKPAMEKKRLLDIINMVQGEWIHCEEVVARISDVISQVGKSDTTKNHQKQVLELTRACTEASITWGVLCRDRRPAWARQIRTGVESIVRENKRTRKATGKSGRRLMGRGGRNSTQPDIAVEDAPWSSTRYFQFLHPIVPMYWETALCTFGIHHPEGVATGKCILRMHLRWKFAEADAAPTRAQRQTLRCKAALDLLAICESAVHLNIVQSTLKDFRQELLMKQVFSRSKDDPILGKFSEVSPNEEDDINDSEDEDDEAGNNEKSLVRPFRIGGFYGFQKLTPTQGRAFAEFLVNDVENSDLSFVERVKAVNKLQFIPAVGYSDFANLLMKHFSRRTKYAEVMRTKKKDIDGEIDIEPPLPKAVVETLFKAVLADDSPLALFSLLKPTMMREGSTKTTILVAERAVVLLSPVRVTELIQRLFARKGRDGLLVGPLKAFLRILYSFALKPANIVGEDVIKRCIKVLTAQWDPLYLHRDARVLMVHNALKALSTHCNAYIESFAWTILHDVAVNNIYPDSLRGVLLCAEPAARVVAAESGASSVTKEFTQLHKEFTDLGKIELDDKSRFVQVLITTIRTCEKQVAEAKQNLEKAQDDKRMRGIVKKAMNVAGDLRAMLLMNLAAWVNESQATYEIILETLERVIAEISDEKPSDENQSRLHVANTVVPKQLALVASAAHEPSRNPRVYIDSGVPTRITSIVRPLLNGLIREIPLSEKFKRLACASALKALTSGLSKEGRKKSLYRLGYAAPFKTELKQLRDEMKLNSIISALLPAEEGEQQEDVE